MRLSANIARFACGSAVAAALAFGAAQAAATPAPAAGETRVCNPQLCDRACRAIGAFGGFCNAAGGCSCYIGTP